MDLLDLFRGKKKNPTTETRQITELEKLCGDDKETYEALFNVMFPQPKRS